MSKLDLAPTQPLAISPDRLCGTLGAAQHGKPPPDGASSDQAGGALLYTDSQKFLVAPVPLWYHAFYLYKQARPGSHCRVVTAYVGVPLDWQPGRVFHERM